MENERQSRHGLYLKMIGFCTAVLFIISTVLVALLSWHIVNTDGRFDDLENGMSSKAISLTSLQTSITAIEEQVDLTDINVAELSNEQVSAFCVNNIGVTNIVGGSAVDFLDEDANIGGDFDLTNDHYTTPCNGTYMFTLDVQTTDNIFRGVLRVDGDDLSEKYVVHNTQNYGSGAFIAILSLENNQQVDIKATSTSGSSFATVRFTGQLLFCSN